MVFRDKNTYSIRHGVGLIWQHSEDTLWILSSDIGHSKVTLANGKWSKTFTKEGIPPEVKKWL